MQPVRAYSPFTSYAPSVWQMHYPRTDWSMARPFGGSDSTTFEPFLRREALEVTRAGHAVIVARSMRRCALRDEGMCLGHIVLRSRRGGMEEQLDHGVNGGRIGSTESDSSPGVLERVLDKPTCPNDDFGCDGTGVKGARGPCSSFPRTWTPWNRRVTPRRSAEFVSSG